MAEAEGARGVHVGNLANRERAGTHHPGALGDEGDDDGNDHVLHAGPEGRNHRQRHDDEREGEEDVHDPLDDQVEQPAEVGACDADDEAGGRSHERGDEPDEQCGTGSVEDARQDVAAELVGAHQELPARRGEHVLQGGPFGVEGGEDSRRRRRCRHQDHDEGAGGPERLPSREVPQTPEERLLQLVEVGGVDECLRGRHGSCPSCSGCAGPATRRRRPPPGSSAGRPPPPASPGVGSGRSPGCRRSPRTAFRCRSG